MERVGNIMTNLPEEQTCHGHEDQQNVHILWQKVL